MNNIYRLFVMAITICLLPSCNDSKESLDKLLEEFNSIIYIKDSGVQKIDMSDTETNEYVYTSTIIKAGADLSKETSVQITGVDKEELNSYNEENNTNFDILPENCYKLEENSTINFSSEETYKHFNVTLFKDKVNSVIEQRVKTTYVLPLKLTNSPDSINQEKNILIIQPVQ